MMCSGKTAIAAIAVLVAFPLWSEVDFAEVGPEEYRPLRRELRGYYPEGANPKTVFFCDFASAGNTWARDDYYRTWFPVEWGVCDE